MAAVPAPMKTNAKVPMNSASSLGAIRLDMLISRDERAPFGAIRFAPKIDRLLGVADGTNARRRPVT